MGTLYIVGTPIGNLRDITDRALEVLRAVDIVFAEDTRVTKKLFTRYNIAKPLVRSDMHTRVRTAQTLETYIHEGKNVALVTDAGTPGIADPGAFIVNYIRTHIDNAQILSVPGPSAVTAALSISGFSADQFTFLGYPPHKKKRASFFKMCESSIVRPVIFFESPHRVEKSLKELSAAVLDETNIFIARELTKQFEETFSGSAIEGVSWIQAKKIRGEFIIIVE